jgi:hypothetical protein
MIDKGATAKGILHRQKLLFRAIVVTVPDLYDVERQIDRIGARSTTISLIRLTPVDADLLPVENPSNPKQVDPLDTIVNDEVEHTKVNLLKVEL